MNRIAALILIGTDRMRQDGGPTVVVETAVLGFFSYRFREGALPFLFYWGKLVGAVACL